MADLSHYPAARALLFEINALPGDSRSFAWLGLSDLVNDVAGLASGDDHAAEAASLADHDGVEGQLAFLFSRRPVDEIVPLIRGAAGLEEDVPTLSEQEFRHAIAIVIKGQSSMLAVLDRLFPGRVPAALRDAVTAAIAGGVFVPLARAIAAARPVE